MKYTDKLNMGLPESQDEIDIEELNRNFKVLDVESNRIEVSETKPTNPNVDVWVKPSAKPVALATQEFVNEKVNPVSEQVTALSEQIVQSDWNENDPQSKAFVKNRICYAETEEKILFDGVLDGFNGGFLDGDPTKVIANLVTGTTKTVTWDGVTYEAPVSKYLTDSGEAIIIGNPVFLTDAGDNGIPFAGAYVPEAGLAGWLSSDKIKASHTVKILGVSESVTPIPNKFVPKDWAENDPNSSAYIKNRFGGYDNVYEQTLLESTEVVLENGSVLVQNSITPNVGDTVSLVIDDITYECKATFNPMLGLFIGNSGLFDIGPDTGEKYLAFWSPTGQMAFAFVSDTYPVTKTVAIYKGTQGPVKIPEKYLPQKIEPDWNENDPNSPNYIKNRFGGYDTVYDGLVLAETSILAVDNAEITFLFDLYDGNTTTIINGTKYVSDIFNIGNFTAFGNPSIYKPDHVDNGMPFVVLYTPGFKTAYIQWDRSQIAESETVTMTIYKGIEEVVKIPEKYLPTPPDPLPPITPELDTAFLQAVDGQPTWVKLIDRSKVGG